MDARSSGRFLEAAYGYYHQMDYAQRVEADKLLDAFVANPQGVKPWDLGMLKAVRGNDPTWNGFRNEHDLHIEALTPFPQVHDTKAFMHVMYTLISVEHFKHLGQPHSYGGAAPLRYIRLRQLGKTANEAYALR